MPVNLIRKWTQGSGIVGHVVNARDVTLGTSVGPSVCSIKNNCDFCTPICNDTHNRAVCRNSVSVEPRPQYFDSNSPLRSVNKTMLEALLKPKHCFLHVWPYRVGLKAAKTTVMTDSAE